MTLCERQTFRNRAHTRLESLREYPRPEDMTLPPSNVVQFCLSRAYANASTSPDRSNQNGAILVTDNRIIGEGCNDFPLGTPYTDEQLADREWKLFNIEHAERNAIYQAVRAKAGIPGATLYCPWFACSDCARAILLTGIYRVVGHKQRMDMTPDRWKASVEAGLKILRDGGVALEFYDGVLNASPIIVNGESWQP